MSTQEAISELDAGLAEVGETVRLLRMINNPGAAQTSFEVSCRAIIRGYSPSDLVPGSGITQQDQIVIMSPTPIIAAGWPGPSVQRAPGDPRVPRQNDRIVSNRGLLTIQAATGIYVNDELVRIEIQARGT